MQKAEDYLRKRVLGGHESSLLKVFGDLDADYGAESSEDDNFDDSRVESDAAENNNSETTESMPTSYSAQNNANDSADDDACLNTETMAQWKEKRRIQNAKLLQSVKDGKVETHLLGVYTETIPSDRHQKFKSGSDAEKDKLKHVPWFGPIDDEDQQEEIYDYCSQLFKTNFKPDANFDSVAYLFEVWVPEVR